MNTYSRIVIIISLALLAVGCSRKPTWLYGNWTIDGEATKIAAEKYMSSIDLIEARKMEQAMGGDGFFSGMSKTYRRNLLIEAFKNDLVYLTITDTEIVLRDSTPTTPNGFGFSGKIGYRVGEAPDSKTVRLMNAANEAMDWAKSGDGIESLNIWGVLVNEPALKFPLVFKRRK